ncbi:Major intrinsic protein family and Aquaporin-like domain-containing protein [Strongyloides ratti]|uniref:Major intrinsic protein family and Aquaporin-like domain-containing protein n=1 Tax=Strongyloides ratti TaxID=34506 RepID=A0A090LUU1_STRRB|nr:Major intrinsic protein family and Aquaporin-like domain-containing protein [Strongyloides ratti]CEF71404.1 Major intrinsic protein family and Aquaporin-like domain-containing protein [Strongyloides ratti]
MYSTLTRPQPPVPYKTMYTQISSNPVIYPDEIYDTSTDTGISLNQPIGNNYLTNNGTNNYNYGTYTSQVDNIKNNDLIFNTIHGIDNNSNNYDGEQIPQYHDNDNFKEIYFSNRDINNFNKSQLVTETDMELGTEPYQIRTVLRNAPNQIETNNPRQLLIETTSLEKKYNSNCSAIIDRIIRPMVSEFIAVTFITFIYYHINEELQDRYLQNLQKIILMSFLEALIMTCLLTIFQTVHMSPMISIAHLFALSTSWFICIIMIFTQFAGTVAGILLYNVTSNSLDIIQPALIDNLKVEWKIVMIKLVVCQFVGTMLIVMCNLIITYRYGRGAIFIGKIIRGPLCYFTSIFLASFLSLLHSTVSWNPLQAFSLSFLESIRYNNIQVWENHYIFWSGPLLGTLVAVVLYRVIFAQDGKRLNIFYWCGPSNKKSNSQTLVSVPNNLENGNCCRYMSQHV